MEFTLHQNTPIRHTLSSPPVLNAVSILKRDMEKTLAKTGEPFGAVCLKPDAALPPETYRLQVSGEAVTVLAGDDLGFVYGLLFISREFLGIRPFWFWMDQEISFLGQVRIPEGTYDSPIPAVRFRGWFLNDEVLFLHWNQRAKDFPWHMALEALLRCGGNLIIPGTDKSSRLYAPLADRYGLWLTHHHAEPLGAEIFARAYPELAPSYSQNPRCFENLWEEAVIRQKDMHVVWTLGFRGQGDCPFWESRGEEVCDTSEKRGRLISDVIELQRRIVCRHVEHPLFCTNLYGEVLELYREGLIRLHPDVIKIWGDNGYGKMCTRRQGNHDARVPSLPGREDTGRHGVYYHVSFHDLQAAGHITTLPNPVDFVSQELTRAYEAGIREYWIVNSSNIRPHVYYLDAIRKLWYGAAVSDESHSREFAGEYFGSNEEIARCLNSYARSLLSYGNERDQKAGEQFYNYSVRLLARQFILDKNKTAHDMILLTGQVPLNRQAACVLDILQRGMDSIEQYFQSCRETGAHLSGNRKILFESTVLLQARIHRDCCRGAVFFCRGFLLLESACFQKGFYLLGRSAECFESADSSLRQAEYGVWKGFYENDCLTDIRFTAYLVRTLMRTVRVLGDDSRMADWYEDFVRPKEDRKVRLLAITDHHMTDDDLFEAMKPAAKEKGWER